MGLEGSSHGTAGVKSHLFLPDETKHRQCGWRGGID